MLAPAQATPRVLVYVRSVLGVDAEVTGTPTGDRKAGASETPTTTRPAWSRRAVGILYGAVMDSRFAPHHISCLNVLKRAKPQCAAQFSVGQFRAGQVRVAQVRASQPRVGQVRTLQIRFLSVAPCSLVLFRLTFTSFSPDKFTPLRLEPESLP